MIAVFKISLTLCISICRAFGQIGTWGWGGKPEEGGGRLIGGDLQTLCSLVTFSQAEAAEQAGYTLFFHARI